MKVASFFSGIGGFDLGFERAGMEVVFQCEKDEFCQRVLKKHWPDVTLYDDITTLTEEDFPSADLYCGGFPCQDVSLANQGKRQGLKGARSGLFYTFAKIIEARKPKWVVLENVPGLLNSNQGRDFQVVLQTLDEFGYGVAWRVLDAKFFGTPQRRRRVFIVASYQSLSAAAVLFDEQTSEIPFGSRQRSAETTAARDGIRHNEPALYTIQHAAVGRKHTAGPQSKGYRNDGETWTLDSRGSSDVLCATDDAFRIRDATGFSKRMDSRRYRALGNAVCVPVAEWIGQRILKLDNVFKDEQFPVDSLPDVIEEKYMKQLSLF